MIPWNQVEILFLDMDGTLLDLHYDNFFWNQYLPETLAAERCVPLSVVEAELAAICHEVKHSLRYYCTSYWSGVTNLNIIRLKERLAHLIRYRADAKKFIHWLRQMNKRILILTNADPHVIELKHRHTGLLDKVDAVISAHNVGLAKEESGFWQRLAEVEKLDPERTLFIDDNLRVLQAARQAGFPRLVAVNKPDSRKNSRSTAPFPSVDKFQDLLPRNADPYGQRRTSRTGVK